MDIIIRNLDPILVQKIDELAKKQGVKRQEFLKNYIETLGALESIKEIENNYITLINQMSFVIKENSNLMKSIKKELMLEE